VRGVLDTGASHWMTGDKGFFCGMVRKIHQKVSGVSGGQASTAVAVGRGRARVSCEGGGITLVNIPQILYVPALAGQGLTLCSISALVDLGVEVTCHLRQGQNVMTMTLQDGNEIIVPSVGGIYDMELEVAPSGRPTWT
jgi:hypothetical protein